MDRENAQKKRVIQLLFLVNFLSRSRTCFDRRLAFLWSKKVSIIQRLYKGSNPGGSKHCKNREKSEFQLSGVAKKGNFIDFGNF